mmetsp:Transcript_25689/g.56651  ORF Transcript_25689/g.56651 Transcript_25689/m.56651 type:complete len:108 (+) Transcript_25689:54-377(+)|eukprot:CAMPEP_0170620402 /NCGR_PEP_ID=MMETSP0224-20130122/28039_1 /TAXON_ID=285029 /ORGANISM="Togula jolla, Strain CCCM 725" /LENGTH=107 /DNA_ID=CAMNT_0010946573 /DNA_START=52 /DNA_END=375 /DNA_ORIENTATION=-
MARSSVLSMLAVAGLVTFGLRSVFVPGPHMTVVEAPASSAARFLGSSAMASAATLVAAAPALAEEDPAEEYNRKVLTGAAYVLMMAFFLLGLIVVQARKVVENKWLN